MLAAVDDRPTFEKFHQPIEMTLADDPPVIRTLLRIFSIEFNQGFLQIPDKLRSDLLEDEDIVRRGACLTGIEPTPKGDATCGNPQICRGVDDGWILSAEFEHHRRQVLRCRGH